MKINRYKCIPEKNDIRFRNTKIRYEIYLSWLPELRSIKENSNHEMHQMVKELFPSDDQIELAQIVYEFSSHMIEYVDYFECNDNFQVSLFKFL